MAINVGILSESMDRTNALQEAFRKERADKAQRDVVNTQNQENLDIARKNLAINREQQAIQSETYQDRKQWIDEGTQINTIAQGLSGITTPEEFQARLKELELADNGVNAEDIQRAGLTFDNYKQKLTDIAALHGDIGIRSGYITPSRQSVDTIVRTVMVEGQPTDVLYNKMTGEPIRVLGVAKPDKSGVNVNVGGKESTFSKEIGKLGAKTIGANMDVIRANEKSLKAISSAEARLKELGDTPYTGALSGIANSVASFADALGIDSTNLDTAQQLDGILTSIAIQGRVPGSGVDTDKDFENRKNALGSMGNTTEALKGKLALAKSIISYENKYNKLYNETLLATDGDQQRTEEIMSKWVEKNPYKVPALNSAKSAANTPRMSEAALRAEMTSTQANKRIQLQD